MACVATDHLNIPEHIASVFFLRDLACNAFQAKTQNVRRSGGIGLAAREKKKVRRARKNRSRNEREVEKNTKGVLLPQRDQDTRLNVITAPAN